MDERSSYSFPWRKRQFFIKLAEEVQTSAKAYVKLNYPKKNGLTLRDEYAQLEKANGFIHPSIKKAEPPSEAFFVWKLYWERFRSTGLTFAELQAYQEVMETKLTAWEIDTMFLINNAVESEVNTQAKNQTKTTKLG